MIENIDRIFGRCWTYETLSNSGALVGCMVKIVRMMVKDVKNVVEHAVGVMEMCYWLDETC